ncbi:hypothetical protein [Maribacter sp. 2308TA10-17]|uniref:hypothetical protein n=1 Tax=Maribacter sp. 2308TA10-17 TaxID=3386276 RepID=UPI0039BD0DD7
MVVLRKIKGATLMETMVATVLIVVIFMIASLLLNSIFSSSIQGNNQQLTSYLNLLEYQYKNNLISVPHYEELDDWDIELLSEEIGASSYLILEATHKTTKKTLKTYTNIAE